MPRSMKSLDRRPHVHDLGQRFVPDHQVVVSRWRGSVLEGADFLVGATDADVEHPQRDLVRLGEPGGFLLDDPDLSRSWEDCDRLHAAFTRCPAPGKRTVASSPRTPAPGHATPDDHTDCSSTVRAIMP